MPRDRRRSILRVMQLGPLEQRVLDYLWTRKDPVTVREGGTIGAILFMEQILKCPIVFMGLSLPEHGYHAPNENYDWHQAGGGIAAFAKFIEEIALHPR